ncbi:MAG: response regulator transcription factor [Sphaerochaeta sp.]|nr:response regulator transcription factor [Sphaerochaeta sp.]
MGTENILIIDDDEAIRKLLSKVMVSNGMEPTTVSSGESALALLKTREFNLILLDITLEDMDGFTVLKHLRSWGIHTPVIIISGKTEDYDALYGLNLGADDYITKPFNAVVLGAKAKALIRRASENQESKGILSAGPFALDLKSLRFYKDGEEIFLSGKELTIMGLFLHHPGQVFTKEELYIQVWGHTVVDDNAIMVYINRLRNKIETDPKNPVHLKTIWGIGYIFSSNE